MMEALLDRQGKVESIACSANSSAWAAMTFLKALGSVSHTKALILPKLLVCPNLLR